MRIKDLKILTTSDKPYQILVALKPKGKDEKEQFVYRIRELQEILKMSANTINYWLYQLEKQGLVAKYMTDKGFLLWGFKEGIERARKIINET